MKKIAVLLCLLLVGFAPAAELPKSVKASPCKTPPTIDGQIEADEWADTKPVEFDFKLLEFKTMTSKTKTAEIFGADRFQAAFGEINERAKAASEKGAKIAEELTDLTRGNVEALVASSKVAQKGFETLSQGAADFGRKSFEEASATLKSLTEVKSATDLFKLQGDYARSAFDAAVAESARLSEAMLKIASDVAEPINSRYTVAAERVKTLAAA